jgi:predicted DNA-binding protein
MARIEIPGDVSRSITLVTITHGRRIEMDITVSVLADDRLDALALTTGVPKGEHVRRAISDYIAKQEGFNPDNDTRDRPYWYYLPKTPTT